MTTKKHRYHIRYHARPGEPGRVRSHWAICVRRDGTQPPTIELIGPNGATVLTPTDHGLTWPQPRRIPHKMKRMAAHIANRVF